MLLLLLASLIFSFSNGQMDQPAFQSSFMIEGNENNDPTVLSDLSDSPFLSHRREITGKISQLFKQQQDVLAFRLLFTVIQRERNWRRQLCVKFFGPAPCKTGSGDRPFGIWRKRLINYLVSDPTAEIVGDLETEFLPQN